MCVYVCVQPFVTAFHRPDEELRVQFYEDLNESMKTAAKRAEDANPPLFRAMINELTCVLQWEENDRNDKLRQMALDHGFDPNWMTKPKKEKKRPLGELMQELKETRLTENI